MYYIRKTDAGWMIRNNTTGAIKTLNDSEIENLLREFPNLRNSRTVTYFRNKVRSIPDLP
jgi:predicted transcriptional regulator